MKKPELTAQILGMYIGRRANIEFKNYYTATDSDVITPALVGYFVLGDVDVTPHLRRLGSITEEECREVYLLENGEAWGSETDCKMNYWDEPEEWYCPNRLIVIGTPKVWLYLLSRGFDLFGLIDAGLAEEVEQ